MRERGIQFMHRVGFRRAGPERRGNLASRACAVEQNEQAARVFVERAVLVEKLRRLQPALPLEPGYRACRRPPARVDHERRRRAQLARSRPPRSIA